MESQCFCNLKDLEQLYKYTPVLIDDSFFHKEFTEEQRRPLNVTPSIGWGSEPTKRQNGDVY